MKRVRLRVGWLALFLAGSASAQEHYDLGGPCQPEAGIGPFQEILKAEKSGAWDRAVELHKLSVRGMCGNDYRWQMLAKALLTAGRDSEAVRVLQEMDSRGFELSPSQFVRMQPELAKFMESATFLDSPIGQKVKKLREEADTRRVRLRETLRAMQASQRPPDNYVAKGACPFECCRFGAWTVEKDTDLVAAPGSSQVVGRDSKGSKVTALTGEVHLKPDPVVVLWDGELPKGSIVFARDYQGEGF